VSSSAKQPCLFGANITVGPKSFITFRIVFQSLKCKAINYEPPF
jgi:hypothetical protein